MYGNYFYYNGHTSQEFGLIIVGFDTDTSVPLGLSRNVLAGEMNRFRKIPNFMGTAYEKTLSFSVSCMKSPCSDNDLVFTEDEVDEITSWITGSDYPILFHMYDYEPDVYKKYDYFAVCSNVEAKTEGERIVGFTFSFVTNSPYAWTDQITYQFTTDDDETPDEDDTRTVTITVSNSERLHEIFPVIIIEPNLDGAGSGERVEVTLKNNRDSGEMTLSLLRDTTTIDCQRSIISGTAGLLSFEDLGIADVDQIYWFRLYDGANEIEITGDATVTFEYREPRKVGAY